MAKERQLQRDIIDNFVLHLGYEEKKQYQTFKGLIIKEDLLRFLNSSRNKVNFEKLVKKDFKGSQQAAIDAFVDDVIENFFAKHIIETPLNTAILLQKTTYKFRGYEFRLFYPRPSPNAPSLFEENIFSIVEELIYRPAIDYEHKHFDKHPDLVFYVNGFLFSLFELKSAFQGTSAENGVTKIIANYCELVSNFVPERINKQKQSADEIAQRSVVMSLYEKAVHVAAGNDKGIRACRNIRDFRPVCQDSLVKGNIHTNREFELAFQDVPRRKAGAHVKNMDVFISHLADLYSKEAIENEILYYNYQERNGANKRPIISPRPKQKFGVDITIDRVREMYKHESNPCFVESEYRAQLHRHNVPECDIDDEVEKRMSLVNGTGFFSILKQYAAGFGKTKLMSWEAARLIGMHNNSGRSYLFDKVILVSDRLDLRDQMGQTLSMMPNMSDKLWQIAEDTGQFMRALSEDTCRIIVVNIQKFLSLSKKLTKHDKKMLASMRAAFIIDEVHRSNDGDQNDVMMSLFEGLSKQSGSKKSLIIGLTATAKDKTLQRFGEVAGFGSNGMNFEPFDVFSMKEAIRAGFVLNPMDNFIAVHQPILIDESKIGLGYRLPTKKDFYKSEDKITGVVKKSMDFLESVTFTKLRKPGTGSIAKAMYVGDSIDASIFAFHTFKEEIEKRYGERDNKPEVFIVFSNQNNDQQYRATAVSLNGGVNEKQVIKNFKASNNAIMVVIDKLQTGFDEPTLHTLILNTERKDVTMVQTLCRVNRTHKLKEECIILDFSVVRSDQKTQNEVNAEEAFSKFAGMNTSALNFVNEEKFIKKSLSKAQGHYVYKTLYNDYLRAMHDSEHEMNVFIPAIRKMHDSTLKDFFELAKDIFGPMERLGGVMHIDSKIKSDIKKSGLEHFLQRIRGIIKADTMPRPALPFRVLEIGFAVDDMIIQTSKGNENSSEGKLDSVSTEEKSDAGESEDEEGRLLNAVFIHNEFNEMSKERIIEFMDVMRKVLIEVMNSEGLHGVNNALKTEPFGDYQKAFIGEFEFQLGKMGRKLKQDGKSEIKNKIQDLVKKIPGKIYQDYLTMMRKNGRL